VDGATHRGVPLLRVKHQGCGTASAAQPSYESLMNSSTKRSYFARLLDHYQPSAWYVLGSAALLVGLAAGTGIWVFEELILLAAHAFGALAAWLGGLTWWAVAFATAVGGLVVGLILHFFVGVERYHGVAGIIESVALAGGRLRYWRIPAKTVASAVSIGAGASVGPEDPSVQIGANLGSMFGQWLHLSDDRVRVLVAGGSAAGVAAAFNAPIAGVFFSLEIILGEITGSALGAVLLASVVSAAFTQAVSGPQPAFAVPTYPYHSALELPLYLGLGLLAGPIAALYIRLIYWAQDLFHAWKVPNWVKPAAAGLLVGIAALFVPQIQGIGYSTIEAILNNADFTVTTLLVLCVAKLVFTPVSIGGGFLGGVFAPSLFIGATLGGAYGALADYFLPDLVIAPASFAMVGMAAVLAGAIHAPLTAILLLFELTNDYRIILPLMFAVTLSMVVSQWLQRDSVYMFGLARKGIRIERGRDVEVLEGITVADVMEREYATVNKAASIDTAADLLMHLRSHGLPVVDDAGRLAGILTVQDIERAHAQDGDSTVSVGDICTREVLTAFADESMGAALRRMSTRDIGRLPVVDRSDPARMVGLLRRVNVIRAYDVALTRRAALRHRANQVRLGAVAGVEVREFTIESGSPCEGMRVSQIAWPHDCVIATMRRGSRLVIPRGDTLLHAGDVLAVVTEDAGLAPVQALCRTRHAAEQRIVGV
jgi:CIC family chloride channel protein